MKIEPHQLDIQKEYKPLNFEDAQPISDASARASRTRADAEAVSPSKQAEAPVSSLDGDSIEISTEAKARNAAEGSDQTLAETEKKAEKPAPPSQESQTSTLTEEEQKLVEKLEARDAEVRRHEQAHLSAAGALANGAPSYEYQKGPNGRQYAIGGEVSIDTSKVPNDPEATIKKAEKIRRAALAPAEPSNQDRKVAAKAEQLKSEAQREIRQENTAPEADKAGQGKNEEEDPKASGLAQGKGLDPPGQVLAFDRNGRTVAQQDSGSAVSLIA